MEAWSWCERRWSVRGPVGDGGCWTVLDPELQLQLSLTIGVPFPANYTQRVHATGNQAQCRWLQARVVQKRTSGRIKAPGCTKAMGCRCRFRADREKGAKGASQRRVESGVSGA